MAIKLQPAVKTIKPLKVFSYGPTDSGKTLSNSKGTVTAFFMNKFIVFI